METHSITLPSDHTQDKPCPCGCAPCPDDPCGLDCITAPRFFCGQLLSDGDLTAMIDWARAKLRLARRRHGWGVACGLDVQCDPANPTGVVVTPGYAVSACGDDAIVCEPTTIDLADACDEERDRCADLPDRKPINKLHGKLRDEEVRDSELRDRLVRQRGRPVPAEEVRDDPLQIVRETGGGLKQRRTRVAVDVSIAYSEEESQLQAALARGVCDRTSACEPSRTRETFTLSWKVGNGGHPIAMEAARFLEEWDATLDVIREFRAQFGEPEDDGNDWRSIRNWLLRWIDARGLHHFCFVRDRLCRIDADAPVTADIVCDALFGIVQDARTVLVIRGCAPSERSAGVPLARVWLERLEGAAGSCKVTMIDPFAPHRRELGSDAWPAPAGAWNAGQVIWHQPGDACRRLSDAGFEIADTVDFQIGESVAALEQALDCDPFLDCGERPTLQVLDIEQLGKRVVGFCGAAVVTPETKLDLEITKASKVKEATPGQRVAYEFVVTNTGDEQLEVEVFDSQIGDRWAATVYPGAKEPMWGEASVVGDPGDKFINIVRAKGTAADGRTVSATASHTLKIVEGDNNKERIEQAVVERRQPPVTMIRGIGDARAAELAKVGIETLGDLVDAPVERIAEAVSGRVPAATIREWKREADRRVQ